MVAGAVVTPPAALPFPDGRVVQLAAEKDHAACVRGLVRQHEVLFALTGAGQAVVTLMVICPRGTRGDPAALDARDRAVHVEDL